MSYMISRGLCKEDNKRLAFWIKVKQFDLALQIYREMKRKNCVIDKNLEAYMFLRFYREKDELSENNKKLLKFLTKKLIMA